VSYSKKEKETMLQRAKDYMIKKPEVSRARVALYAGCTVSILERWEKDGLLKLPPKMTDKQRTKSTPWGKGFY
jgi:hypothetical protein